MGAQKMTTTWWLMGLLLGAVIAAMLGIGAQIPVLAATVAGSILFFLFLVGLGFDGALHMTHTRHKH